MIVFCFNQSNREYCDNPDHDVYLMLVSIREIISLLILDMGLCKSVGRYDVSYYVILIIVITIPIIKCKVALQIY